MSWFQTKSATKPEYTGLQLQTSVNTLPIPIVWGRNKLAANLIWYTNFRTSGSSGGGKGGLTGSPATGYSYSADLIMALCEGPISGIGLIWKDQSTLALSTLGLTFFNGSTPQTTWGYLSSAYPAQALAYQGTAYVAAASYALGGSANIGNHNFEILGALAGTGVNGVDADPALVINDFLTNPQYGAGFPGASINATSLLGSGGDASLQSYCKALGIAFSPVLTNQEQASSILARWMRILNCAAVWSGGQLKFIPYGDAPIPAGIVSRSVQTSIPIPAISTPGTTTSASIVVCTTVQFAGDRGVIFAFTGSALTYIGASAPTGTGQYGISPPGTYLFWGGDKSQVVNIAYDYTNATSYVPNLTPLYNLTDWDFVNERDGKDPIQGARADPYALPTIQRVECLSRTNQYGPTPVEARDQAQIELYGPRVGSTIQAHEICDEINIGSVVAQTILQRQLYVRAHYRFKLSWEYGLLDPMDVVAISDKNLGLANFPVRILSIEEDENGLLTVLAEELVVGVSTSVIYPTSGPASFLPNQGVAASTVNAPLIYEPPSALTGNVAQLWVGASGGALGIADSNWGGAYVWLSLDNISYSEVATVTQPLRQGFLTAALPLTSGWDTISTLSVDLSESGGALSGTSMLMAQQGGTLSLVASELIAYQSATLAGAHAYNLTGLQRGLDGSPPAAHAAGTPFARLDAAIVTYDIPSGYLGRTLYLKFQSFNTFGAGVQSLSSCVVYTYVATGVGSLGPVAASLATGTSLDYGFAAIGASESDDFGDVTSPYVTSIDLGRLTS